MSARCGMIRRMIPGWVFMGCLGVVFYAFPGSVRAQIEPEPRFLSTIVDMPLMPGFEETEADSLLFDKPDGRIAQAYAIGGATADEYVTHYYKTVLPGFGWKFDGAGTFIRGAERIAIESARVQGRSVIRYTLSPLAAPERVRLRAVLDKTGPNR